MLAFKRRNDGFEWHRYVRTTLRLKRKRCAVRTLTVQALALA